MILKKNVFIVVIVFMLFFTGIGFFPGKEFLFANTSNPDMMNIVSGNVLIQTVLFLVVIFFFFLFLRKKFKRKYTIAVLLVIATWVLCGRTIGVMVWPDGQFSTGWFHMETERFYLCGPNEDCETTLYSHTKIEKLSFWRVRMKNEYCEKIIFIGPFIWNDVNHVFEKIVKK